MTHPSPSSDLALPPALPGEMLRLDDPKAGRLCGYAGRTGHDQLTEDPPILLVHSLSAASSSFDVRPLFEHYSASRATYALDLPGFGLSERSERAYSLRLMTDAVHAMAREIRQRHANATLDVLGLSLSCEYVARAAVETPDAFRTVALVSPTGFDGKKRHYGPVDSSREIPGLRAALSVPLWSGGLYRLLTRPGVVRYFLERTWGGKNIDEALWAYDVLTARQPGAKWAPLSFLSGALFANDINRIYDALALPVWISHGVRGDFVDYQGAAPLKGRPNWHFTEFRTGAMPYFEMPGAFFAAYDDFLGKVGRELSR